MTTLPTNGNGNGGGNPPWGKANPMRGMAYSDDNMTQTYVDLAVAFIKKYPINTIISYQEFDLWLQDQGLLKIPPPETEKKDDAWIGHTSRRQNHREKLNLASAHPRMLALDLQPFFIWPYTDGYQVREPQDLDISQSLMKGIGSFANTRRRQIEYFLQCLDWSGIPHYERFFIESYYEHVNNRIKSIKNDMNDMEAQYQKLYSRLLQATASSKTRETDGNMSRMIESQTQLDFDPDAPNEDPSQELETTDPEITDPEITDPETI